MANHQCFQNKPSVIASYGNLSNCNAYFKSVKFPVSQQNAADILSLQHLLFKTQHLLQNLLKTLNHASTTSPCLKLQVQHLFWFLCQVGFTLIVSFTITSGKKHGQQRSRSSVLLILHLKEAKTVVPNPTKTKATQMLDTNV